ncbi:hypothetical protein HAX54_014836 [Datura stramonium]|uniref:Protein kinase domain-containing protein n=1 Tax=Datura stramonium TaxID=4076 RepID=A0ABS8TQP4_DATST|nr:hypothetical protein [Datura stramonium]
MRNKRKGCEILCPRQREVWNSTHDSGSSVSNLKTHFSLEECSRRLKKRCKEDDDDGLCCEVTVGSCRSRTRLAATAPPSGSSSISLCGRGEETVHKEVEIMQHLSGHPGVVTLQSVYEDARFSFGDGVVSWWEDVKPENILLTASGKIKACRFWLGHEDCNSQDLAGWLEVQHVALKFL